MDTSIISPPPDTYTIEATKTSRKLISDKDRELYQCVNYYVLDSAVSMFGVVANVMNMVVFWKQGFNNTMNISLFALSISDCCNLVTLLWNNVAMSGLLAKAGFKMSALEVAYLTGGHPHICFTRITSWITVFITIERSLCIMIPMKVKGIITPRRTTVIMCAIYILIILSFEPEYQTAYIGWKLDVKTNSTFLGLLYTNERKKSEGVVFILYSILGFVSFINVIIFTSILVVQLNRQAKWRRKVNADKTRSEAISCKERKTVIMVVMIAIVLIACYAPGVLLSLVTFFEPEFSVGGQYVNAFFALWSFVFVFEALNSSVNIFIYYHMSTKYRRTFRMVFCFWKTELM